MHLFGRRCIVTTRSQWCHWGIFLQPPPATRSSTRSPPIGLRRAVEQSNRRSNDLFRLLLSQSVFLSLSSCPLLSRTVSLSLGHHSDFPPPFTHTNTLCLFVWRHALGALSESERIKSEKDELYLFLTLLLSLDGSTRSRLPMLSRREFEGKEIFSIPFAEFLICYVIYSSH